MSQRPFAVVSNIDIRCNRRLHRTQNNEPSAKVDAALRKATARRYLKYRMEARARHECGRAKAVQESAPLTSSCLRPISFSFALDGCLINSQIAIYRSPARHRAARSRKVCITFAFAVSTHGLGQWRVAKRERRMYAAAPATYLSSGESRGTTGQNLLRTFTEPRSLRAKCALFARRAVKGSITRFSTHFLALPVFSSLSCLYRAQTFARIIYKGYICR